MVALKNEKVKDGFKYEEYKFSLPKNDDFSIKLLYYLCAHPEIHIQRLYVKAWTETYSPLNTEIIKDKDFKTKYSSFESFSNRFRERKYKDWRLYCMIKGTKCQIWGCTSYKAGVNIGYDKNKTVDISSILNEVEAMIK